jgi:hypothetical protein
MADGVSSVQNCKTGLELFVYVHIHMCDDCVTRASTVEQVRNVFLQQRMPLTMHGCGAFIFAPGCLCTYAGFRVYVCVCVCVCICVRILARRTA